jgi:hypothetical protein
LPNRNEWIVQGSDAVDPIQVKEETVATPSNLQEIAKNTQHPDKQSIFDPFPTGGGNEGGGGQDTGSNIGSIRNPYEVCKDLDICPE